MLYVCSMFSGPKCFPVFAPDLPRHAPPCLHAAWLIPVLRGTVMQALSLFKEPQGRLQYGAMSAPRLASAGTRPVFATVSKVLHLPG